MSSFLDELNPAQKEATEAVDGAVMVLAGAGSGKTRVLTHRIAYMVRERGVNPDDILAVTFTNKAADEMKNRLIGMLGNIGRMLVTTIHSMCTRILRFEAVSAGYTSNFSIYTENESEKVLKNVIKRLGLGEKDAELPFAFHISKAKNEGLTPSSYYAEYLESDFHGKVIFTVMKEYGDSLKSNNAMDFDDLVCNTFFLLKNNPDTCEKYGNRFRYISVDEFQDTNRVQYYILKMLAAKYGNLFVVGDDDQSIYGWRGAEVRNILDFKKDFPDVRIYKLEQNYRSTKKILGVANEIISKNGDRFPKKLWTENSDGVRIEMYSAPSESEEATFVVNQIMSLHRYNGLAFGDCAILMRINALSRSFEQELLKFGVPSRVYGGFKFFDRKEVKDILAYFRLIDNPCDDEAFYRVVNFPRRGIGETSLNKLRVFAEECGYHALEAAVNCEEITGLSTALRCKIKDFAKIILDMTEASDAEPLLDFTDLLFEVIQLRSAYSSENKGDYEKSIVVDEFRQAVADFAKSNPGARLGDFLQSVSLQADYDRKESSDDAVTIATVHSAKGLEFRTVFVVGLEQGIFPGTSAQFSQSQMEEERRLMYVAVTRAMERLYLTRACSRFLYGQRKEQAESPFFRQVALTLNYESPDRYSSRKSGERFVDDYGASYRNGGDYEGSSSERRPSSYGEYAAAKTKSDYPPGTKIVHKVFGDGIVIRQKGDNIDVAFKGIGVKTLAVKFAPITKKQ